MGFGRLSVGGPGRTSDELEPVTAGFARLVVDEVGESVDTRCLFEDPRSGFGASEGG